MTGRYRLGIDIGGTFTDFTLVDTATGAVAVEKVLTTPGRPEQAVFQGIERLAEPRPSLLAEAEAVIHATTLLTNVVIERKGARTGLVTTEGFRDILEVARELRYDIYDAFIRFSDPLVPRALRLGIDERMTVDGSVYRPIDRDGVAAALRTLGEAGVEAVAVCFLHAYKNPAHEELVRELAAEILPGVEVSISSEVHPEPKEFERTSTTVVDAYVKPVATRYLSLLGDELAARGYRHPLLVMMSNGGTAGIRTARRFPVQLIESGPAAGVEAVAHYGKLMRLPKLLSFDMGGTTAKLCLLQDGNAARTRSFEVDRIHRFKAGSGIPIAVPVYDLLEIGAGGGSIARIDGLGLLQVGPDSAGSSPGPASYGLGGRHPTVTDADLAIGFLDPDYFLGGAMPLDREAALAAIDAELATPLGLDAAEAAAGVHDLVNETMASAARVYVAEKGETARNLSLVAFGGAGPVHAVGLARKLGCPEVIVPPQPGVMSSFGLLAASVSFERARALRDRLADVPLERLAADSAELERQASAELPPGAEVVYERTVEARLVGQEYPLEIPVAGAWTDPATRATIRDGFLREYERLYGRSDPSSPIELVTIRVRARQVTASPQPPAPAAGGAATPKGRRRVYLRGSGWHEVPVYERANLAVDAAIDGPAIVEERESTVVIGIGDKLSVDAIGCLRVRLAQRGQEEA